MLASLLIVFREVLEAGLIVGIVLAASNGVAGRGRWVAGGIAAGLTGAALVASCAGALSQALDGVGQEIFTVAILGLAVTMLGWHAVWMSRHGREMAEAMKDVGRAVAAGEKSLFALSVVTAVAVLREGSEVVLFLYGIAKSTGDGPLSLLAGGMAGVALGVATAFALYRGLLAIPTRHLFSVTNGLVIVLAAGMAGQAASLLASIDVLPSWGERIWNSSAILSEQSLLGRALHALVGYSAQPSGIQLAAWIVTLTALATLSRLVGQQRRPLGSSH